MPTANAPAEGGSRYQAGRRVTLIAAVAPIAIARNGLRIFVIGSMCVEQGPVALDSLLHRQGGPVFFALSLVPWTFLLLVLCRRENAACRPASVSQEK